MRLLAAGLLAIGTVEAASADGALTVYGGQFTTNDWEDFFLSPAALRFADSYMLALAPAWVVARPVPGLDLEVEGQVARHFGDQGHWEFNGVLAARWRDFPWRNRVRTSVAFGIGPSWATERPALEPGINGGHTQRLLVYWYLEATAAPAGWTNWAGSLRLHHRSSAFGLAASAGGSNILALGLRRQF